MVLQNESTVLERKTKFTADYLYGDTETVHPALPGDVVPYHMSDTVVYGETDDVAVVVGLINHAGGFLRIETALRDSFSFDYTKA